MQAIRKRREVKTITIAMSEFKCYLRADRALCLGNVDEAMRWFTRAMRIASAKVNRTLRETLSESS